MENLRLKIFYPDSIQWHELEDFNRAFKLWNDVYIETREEVDPKLPTPSDSFSRQHEIIAIYDGDRAIATACHRYVDLRHTYVLRDSYFLNSIWPQSVRENLPNLGNTCALGSHIFLDKDYRKSRCALNIKEIICNLSFTQVNAAQPDMLVGMMRSDRGLSNLLQKQGGHVLYKDTNWYQIPVDLVVFYPKQEPIRIDNHYFDILEKLGRTCQRYKKSYYHRYQGDEKYVGPNQIETRRSA